MNPGIILALGSALAYGSADFIGGVGSRRHSSLQIVLMGQLTGALVMLVAGVFIPGTPTSSDFLWAVLAGVGSATGSIFLFRGLARGRMGLVAPISAVVAAALPVLVGSALGERSGWFVWVAMAAALAGVWLVARDTATAEEPRASRSALIDGCLAGLGFGFLFVALAQISSEGGLLPIAVNQGTGAALTLIVTMALRQPVRPTRGVMGWGGVSGALGSTGTLAFMIASGRAGLGMTSVLASLYPAITVLLAALVLGEGVGARQRTGIGVCAVAAATLALA